MFDNIFDGLALPAIRTLYKKLAHQYHPDKGGSTEKMQELNAKYKQALTKIDRDSPTASEFNMNFEIELMEKIQKVIHLQGIELEVLGAWLWITGETKPVKDYLKESGFFFSPKKVAWYFRKESDRQHWRGAGKPLDEIRSKYGSQQIKTNRVGALV